MSGVGAVHGESSPGVAGLGTKSQDRGLIDGLHFLWLEVTRKCSMACRHCYADSDPEQALLGALDADAWCSIIDEGATLGCGQVQFIGGEPTLHPDLPVLVRRAADRGMAVEVFTNGIAIRDDLWALFLETGVALAVSFYSSDVDAHEAVTRRPGSFARTRGSICKALDLGLPLRVAIIEQELNRGHAPATLAFLKSLGVERAGVDRERGVGRGAAHVTETDGGFSELCGSCWQGQLAVDADGHVFPCVFSRFSPIGHTSDGLGRLVASASLAAFRRRVFQMEAVSCWPCLPADGQCNPCNPRSPKCNPK